MKKFRVVIFECKSLRMIAEHTVFRDTIEEARELGMLRFCKDNQFSTAERIR